MQVPMSFSFQPITPSGPVTAFVLVCPAGLGMNLEIVNMDAQALTGNLTLLACTLTQESSTVALRSPGRIQCRVSPPHKDVSS